MDLAQGKDKNASLKSGPEKRTKTDAVLKAEAFVTSFIKAQKDVLLYPVGNPVVAESIGKLIQQLKDDFSMGEVLEMLVEKEKLWVGGVEVGANDPRVRELSLSLYRRGVHKLIMGPAVPPDEMRTLLGTLGMKVDQINQAGGIVNLCKSKGIAHAVVEESGGLTIVDGGSFAVSQGLLPELKGLEGIEVDEEHLSSPANFGRMFARVEEGDVASLRRLQALLKNPQLFSDLLERFALQLERVEEEVDPSQRVERLLRILSAVDTAITSLPSGDERGLMLNNLAVSVLGLSANIRYDLIHQGLVPNLALRKVESGILSRFPVSQLAETLLQNFEMSGGASSIIRSYFNNLDLSGKDKSALVNTLRDGLEETGLLSEEIEEILSVEEAETEKVFEKELFFPGYVAPRVEKYPSEKVLFLKNERAQLTSQIMEEFQAPVPDVMAPALLELLCHESSPASHAALVGRARSYLEYFLDKHDYDSASALVTGLHADLRVKKETFTESQLRPLQKLVDEFIGDQKMRELTDVLQGMSADEPEFERLVKYFDAIGPAAVTALLKSLETEESRRSRLLICQIISQIGKRNIVAVAEMLKHPKWFVVRNAVSILGQTGSPAVVPYLRKALMHKDIRVRKETLKALGSVRSGEAIDLLCESLGDNDLAVCKTALGWVGALGVERAVPSLEKLMDEKKLLRRDDELLRLALEALEAVGTEPAVELLRRLTKTRSFLRSKKATFVRERAAEALRSLERE